MGGFSATPEELQQAAKAISDTVGHVSGIPWEGPSGDYGHPGVQQGWGQFVDDARNQVKSLANAAQGHGDNLQQAASDYLKLDQHAADLLGNLIGGAVSGAASGAQSVGHAIHQGAENVAHAVSGWAGTLPSGPEIGKEVQL